MKKFSFSVITVFFLISVFSICSFASTSLIVDTVTHDYGSGGYTPNPGSFFEIPANSDYGTIRESTFSDNFIYNNPNNLLITQFDVEIIFASTSYSNYSNNPEDWYITPAGMSPLAKYLLPDASRSNFLSRVFTFTEAELGNLFGNLADGSFLLAFTETQNSNDSGGWFSQAKPDYFYLDSAKLTVYGQAAPVPLPGAAILLGSAMLGLVGFRRTWSV